MEKHPDIPIFYAKNRKSWRKWLEKNHATAKNVWLIIYKKESGIPSVYYPEAVEEALCFGWIDSKANKRDETSHYQSFTKRNPKSNWSKINKERVARLTGEGLITAAGLAVIELAKHNGTWNALDAVENYTIPNDLAAALNKNKTALKNFNNFAPSSQKIILGWIYSAKRPDTKEKRIAETVSLAAKNIKANHYRQ
jgi:uncharacterized protein YdeI (YjbR/CyaY-like superfamily)